MATQRTSFTDTPNACFNAGRASWTMLASSGPMKAPMQVTPTTSHGWKGWRTKKAAGGGSPPRMTSCQWKTVGALPAPALIWDLTSRSRIDFAIRDCATGLCQAPTGLSDDAKSGLRRAGLAGHVVLSNGDPVAPQRLGAIERRIGISHRGGKVAVAQARDTDAHGDIHGMVAEVDGLSGD